MEDILGFSEMPLYDSRDKITAVKISEGITKIGISSFEECTALKEVTIPDSVTHIGMFAFNDTAYCINKDNWKDGVLYIEKHLIKAEKTISGAYNVPVDTKSIAACAFLGCTSLKSATIPEGLTDIVSGVFLSCI